MPAAPRELQRPFYILLAHLSLSLTQDSFEGMLAQKQPGFNQAASLVSLIGTLTVYKMKTRSNVRTAYRICNWSWQYPWREI